MDASQKPSWVTILVRLSACAMIGVGIMTLYLGVLSSVGSLTMCLAGALVIGFGAVLLATNPRKPLKPPGPNPNATPESN